MLMLLLCSIHTNNQYVNCMLKIKSDNAIFLFLEAFMGCLSGKKWQRLFFGFIFHKGTSTIIRIQRMMNHKT